jgi:HAD superfamily hydrolase (TIGR01509 family)
MFTFLSGRVGFPAMCAAQLEAVIFDVDGTLAETERHGHRVAFNRALEQKGFPDRWSDEMYRDLLKTTGGVRRLTHYFVDYKGWDPEKASALAKELHKIKTGLFLEVVRAGEVPARIGVLRFIKELQDEGLRLGVATTGTASWVHPLIDHLREQGGLAPFETVVTGDLVENLKPAPDVFFLALDRMDLSPDQAVLIEDSLNGVKAAIATGSGCLAVRGEYANASDLEAADLVVDEFGEPERPLHVLHNPWNVEVGTMLNPKVVEDLHRRRLEG